MRGLSLSRLSRSRTPSVSRATAGRTSTSVQISRKSWIVMSVCVRDDDRVHLAVDLVLVELLHGGVVRAEVLVEILEVHGQVGDGGQGIALRLTVFDDDVNCHISIF